MIRRASARSIIGEKAFTTSFLVKTGLSFSNDDLFHDDFKYGMKKWTAHRGEWQVSNSIAMAKGSSHFAFIQSNTWNDYVVEAKAMCRGSNDPVIDWLKCYIFFRLQDEKNFYRFGIHGDAGVIDLYKCVNGKWRKLAFSVFMPKKDKWYALRIQVRGTEITGFLNGHKILEANDGTFPSGGIGIGVLEDAMRCEYKDIVVKKP